MRLTDVLKEDLINVSLSGKTRDNCIKELIEKLTETEMITNEGGVFDAVIEREKIMIPED